MATMRPILSSLSYLQSCVAGLLIGALTIVLSSKVIVLIVGGVFVVAMLIAPQFSYFLLVATIPVQMELIPGITVAKLLIPLIVAMTAFHFITHRVKMPNLAVWPVLSGGLFFLVSFISVSYAGNFPQAVEDLNQVITYVVFFYFTFLYVRTLKDVDKVFATLAITGFLEAVITIAQITFDLQFGGDWRTSSSADVEIGVTGFRADGTTAHPIFLAAYFQVVIPITIGYMLIAKSGVVRLLVLGCIILMLYAWWHTFSRSSVIAAVVMILSCIAIYSRFGRWLVSIGIGVGIAWLSLYGFQLEELLEDFIATLEDYQIVSQAMAGVDLNPGLDSLRFRWESWVAGWYLFLDNPIMGVGLGQAVFEYMAYLPHWTQSASHPAQIHNIFVEVAAEQGVIVFLSFIGLWVYAFYVLIKLNRVAELKFYVRILAIILIGLLSLGMMTPMIREIWFVLGFIVTLELVYRGSLKEGVMIQK